MAKPILQFVNDPPISLNCGQKATIQLNAYPKVVGDCSLSLSLALQSCHFADGTNECNQTLSATSADEKLTFSFEVTIHSDTPGNYFTLLYAFATNANGDKSYRKAIELDIKC